MNKTYYKTNGTHIVEKVADGSFKHYPVNSKEYAKIDQQNIIDLTNQDITLNEVRAKRNGLLVESDTWVSIPDYPLPNGITQQQILDYRQQLRDFPQTVNLTGVKSINEITFPEKPF